MRAFLLSTAAACMAMFMLTPASASAAPASKLAIKHKTSAIYQYDPSPTGNGTLYDTVIVYIQLSQCPVGDYLLSMTFVQDGVSYPLASSALGVGEFSCTVTDSRPSVGMAFYGNGLHPGAALATATVYREADGMPVLAEGSSTVRIPQGWNQP